MIIDQEAKKYVLAELAKQRTALDTFDALIYKEIERQENEIISLEQWIMAAEEPVVIPDPEPEPEPVGKLVYSWNFEQGMPTGLLYPLAQNNGVSEAVANPVGSGKVGVLRIAKTTNSSNAAYLFFTRAIMPEHALLSWSQLIPVVNRPTETGSIRFWQAKTSDGPNTFAQWNVIVLGNEIVVGFRPEAGSAGRTYTNVKYPFGEWVDFQVEYKQDFTAGIMKVWMNGELIFEDTTRPTSTAKQPDISMSIMNYSGDTYGNVYVDDIELRDVA